MSESHLVLDIRLDFGRERFPDMQKRDVDVLYADISPGDVLPR